MPETIYLQCKCGHEQEATLDTEGTPFMLDVKCAECKRVGCWTIAEPEAEIPTEAKHTPGAQNTSRNLLYARCSCGHTQNVMFSVGRDGYDITPTELSECPRCHRTNEWCFFDEIARLKSINADLLEAAEAMLAMLKEHCDDISDDCCDYPEATMLRAAIAAAKPKGE